MIVLLCRASNASSYCSSGQDYEETCLSFLVVQNRNRAPVRRVLRLLRDRQVVVLVGVFVLFDGVIDACAHVEGLRVAGTLLVCLLGEVDGDVVVALLVVAPREVQVDLVVALLQVERRLVALLRLREVVALFVQDANLQQGLHLSLRDEGVGEY